MNCHKCGVAFPPGAQYCPSCGVKGLGAERTYTEDLRLNFRRLSWSFVISLLLFIAIIALGRAKQLDVLPGFGKFMVLALLASTVCFYFFLGILATRMKRSPIVWVGATFVFTPFGPFAAYVGMWRLVRAAIKASENEANASPT